MRNKFSSARVATIMLISGVALSVAGCKSTSQLQHDKLMRDYTYSKSVPVVTVRKTPSGHSYSTTNKRAVPVTVGHVSTGVKRTTAVKPVHKTAVHTNVAHKSTNVVHKSNVANKHGTTTNKIQHKINHADNTIRKAYEDGKHNVHQTTEKVTQKVNNAGQVIQENYNRATTNIQSGVDKAGNKIHEVYEKTKTNIQNTINKAADAVQNNTYVGH